MAYYLQAHPNPNGQFYHPKRLLCQHGRGVHLIVLHTAENTPDFTPPDTGAEAVARYAATTSRKVSWHVTVDSDSTIPMIPDTYTAFHVRNYNRCSLGLEMATKASEWYGSPDAWRYPLLNRVIDQLVIWCENHNIPPVYVTKTQVDAGKAGITGHVELDPSRRSDPGHAFPWNWVLDQVSAKVQVRAEQRHVTLLDSIEAATTELRDIWPT